ncbi:unnamed protein product [Rhizophagus irregularis]|nr:unnamed protein product [Rhizophagus irregularis]
MPENNSETSSIDDNNEMEIESFREVHENMSFHPEMSKASTISYEKSQKSQDFEELRFQEPEELEFQESGELEFQESGELNFQEPEGLEFQESEKSEFQETEELEFQESEELKSKEYTEFPNKAYEDLMTLVTKHKLNNKAGNAIIQFFNKYSNLSQSPLPKSIEKGKAYMNNMKSNLTFTKTLIKVYDNKEYFLYHQNLINCIKNIIAIPDITQDFALSFEDCKYKGERIYKEQNTGSWWKITEDSLPVGAKLLSLILYSDATTTDTLGKNQLHPIYVSIGNIPTWRRNKQDAKQLLAYLPILKSAIGEKASDFKILVREVFHKSLQILLEPIINLKNGIDLLINNESIWFYPRISVIIADWPEAATFCLTYKAFNSNFPCHFLPDRMHHLDLGLFRYQIEYTRELLKSQKHSLINIIDQRLAMIPRYSGLKIFSNGLQSISRLTANEY